MSNVIELPFVIEEDYDQIVLEKSLDLLDFIKPLDLPYRKKRKSNNNGIICLPNNSQTNLQNFNEKPREYKPKPYKRKFTQNWFAYNEAQTKEKILFMKILDSIVEELGIKTFGKKNGRPPFLLKDMIKVCAIKVFNNSSARRTICDIEFASALRLIGKVPHFNSIINYMNDKHMTQFLYDIIKETSIPLAEVEKRFAADATGFSTFCKDKWINVRLDKKKHRDYKKLHAICGVNTNIITSAKVTYGKAADSPHFKELLHAISNKFNIKEVSADAGYLSRENAQAVEDIGATPFIMPKKNTTGKSKGNPAWNRMINLFKQNEAKFRIHYHQRSNIESTFSMMKLKFSPYIKSKHSISQENEILCKVICHNISVLIKAIFELKISLKYFD